jgi:ribonuclease VapC
VSGDTIVVDSSAFVAIFKGETDAILLTERILSYKRRVMSAASWLESAMVCESASQQGGGAEFAKIVVELGVEIIPFTPEQAHLALNAFKRFGKGRGAKASLNYGDCFVYALAKELDAPLLFTGSDFAKTDLTPA